MARIRRLTALLMLIVLMALSALTGCGGGSSSGSDSGSGSSTVIGSGSSVLRIVSGSENRELEPILEEFARKENVKLVMTYEGSIDIMRTLEQDEIPYDAVWPASSLWITMGDEKHRVKHQESISVTPVIFGIRQSLAEKLGFVGKEVSVKDILAAIRSGELSFCMTSATQSNSGACAYIGFLYALLGNPEVITSEDLQSEELKTQIRELLSGVDRSSGSSDWLKDLFLSSDYDAMVNYECLIIQADQELVKEGKEPLYAVYPYDGLTIADSPLGYVDNGDSKKEEIFSKFQEYLLSDDVQNQIQRTGRRTGYTGVADENKDIFNSDWGIQADRVLSPIRMPDPDVLMECLNLYQTEFKKPSLNVYCLDFSGSMSGDGHKQLVKAMEQLLIQKNAEANLLQASENEVNILIPFNDAPIDIYKAVGNGSELESLYTDVENTRVGGGTDIYAAAASALEQLDSYDLSEYSPAIILMTDGQSQGSIETFQQEYESRGSDVPVFSIMFGDASSNQLDKMADLTHARVFDGRDDLIGAFRQVKGYN